MQVLVLHPELDHGAVELIQLLIRVPHELGGMFVLCDRYPMLLSQHGDYFVCLAQYLPCLAEEACELESVWCSNEPNRTSKAEESKRLHLYGADFVGVFDVVDVDKPLVLVLVLALVIESGLVNVVAASLECGAVRLFARREWISGEPWSARCVLILEYSGPEGTAWVSRDRRGAPLSSAVVRQSHLKTQFVHGIQPEVRFSQGVTRYRND